MSICSKFVVYPLALLKLPVKKRNLLIMVVDERLRAGAMHEPTNILDSLAFKSEGEGESSRQSKQAALQRRQRTINRLNKAKQNKNKPGPT